MQNPAADLGRRKTYHGDTEKSGNKTLPLIYTDDTDQEKIGGSERPQTYRGSTRMNAGFRKGKNLTPRRGGAEKTGKQNLTTDLHG